jgi:hypothetical protein
MSISIDRQRHVNWRAAFHFPTRLQGHGSERTDFSIEFLDGQGRKLHGSCLYTGGSSCGCHDGHECQSWPVRISQAVPYVPGARKLKIYEHEREIYSRDIPDPPQCQLSVEVAANATHPSLTARMATLQANGGDASEVWFLLQWQDGKGVWRGVAPRTRDKELTVPLSQFGRRQIPRLRLLASNGVATSIAEWRSGTDQTPRFRRSTRDVSIVLTTAGGLDSRTPVRVPQVMRVDARDAQGRSVPAPQIRWYGSRGTELGRGRSFDLGRLPYGKQILRAVVLDSGYGRGSQQWVVERQRDGSSTVLLGPITHTRRYRNKRHP